MAAVYILTSPHYLALGGYTPAGTTIVEGRDVPIGWRPTWAVDPQNTQAIQNYWNAGPPSAADVNFLSCPQPKPQIYWQPIPGSTSGAYQLTWLGAALGPHS
jgi:hypothetical protein